MLPEKNTTELKPSNFTQGDLNEIEVKLQQMRVKRQNRMSTFVNEHSNLSEQRGRENFRKSLESAKDPEYVKPSLHKTVVTEQSYSSAMRKIGEKPEAATSHHIRRKSQEVSQPIQG